MKIRKWLFLGVCTCGISAPAQAHAFFEPVVALYEKWFGEPAIEVAYEGPSEELIEYLEALELSKESEKREYSSDFELRIEGDRIRDKVAKALSARGYYSPEITYDIRKEEDEPPLLHYQVAEGTAYTVSDVRLEWSGSMNALPEDITLPSPMAGDEIDAYKIEQGAATLAVAISKQQCLLRINVKPSLKLNHEAKTGVLFYSIDAGPSGDFGEMTLAGNEDVELEYIQHKIKWKEGECYDPVKVSGTESALLKTQLFSTSDVTVAQEPGPDGRVPVTLSVKERAARTVKVGASYATDEGVGVKLGWEHRNFFGSGEKVNIDAVLSEISQKLSGIYREPYFYRDDQNLVLNSSLEQESTDVYDSQKINFSGLVERTIDDHFSVGLGGGYSLRSVKDTDGKKENFGLLSFPGFVEYDNRDDPLDSKKGLYARYSLTPMIDTFNQGNNFFKQTLGAQTYFTNEDLPGEPTLALRGLLGSIAGASLRAVPADMRYFAGGGGSVRGYSYQALGPTESDGEVSGGLSLLELSAEARIKFTDEWGGVVFVDAGNAYPDDVPDLSSKLFLGAGAGVRYYSPIGVLRVDVAVPVNGKNRESDSYNLYVSIGQAF